MVEAELGRVFLRPAVDHDPLILVARIEEIEAGILVAS